MAYAGRTCGHAVDREPEHSAGRQQDAVPEQRAADEAAADDPVPVRSGEPAAREPGDGEPLRDGVPGHPAAELAAVREQLAAAVQDPEAQHPEEPAGAVQESGDERGGHEREAAGVAVQRRRRDPEEGLPGDHRVLRRQPDPELPEHLQLPVR